MPAVKNPCEMSDRPVWKEIQKYGTEWRVRCPSCNLFVRVYQAEGEPFYRKHARRVGRTGGQA